MKLYHASPIENKENILEYGIYSNESDKISNDERLSGFLFDGLVDACDDIKESEYYNENCEVYQFSDNNGYKLQIVVF